jgi:hypothetical protein
VTFYACAMLVESVRLRLLLVGPLRLGLSFVWLAAASAAGASGRTALLAYAAGAFGMAFLVSNDPRAHFRRASGEPAELPKDASVAPAWRHAFHASLPSTVGVSVLAAITLAFEPTLSALLAGFLCGMGLVALLGAYRADPRLYVHPPNGDLFRRVG